MTEPFRQRLTLRRDGLAVDGDLEDHIHHIAARVEHDGSVVTGIAGRGIRLPWLTCPEAEPLLDELLGASIGTLPFVADRSAHCTHLLQLARMCIGFAGRSGDALVMTAEVHDWDTPSPRLDVVGDDGSPEAAMFLRRAQWMAPARSVHLDGLDTINQSGIGVGVCYSTQPQRYTIARRNRGSSLEELV